MASSEIDTTHHRGEHRGTESNTLAASSFQKTLKKQMRYEVLKDHLGPIGKDEKCLLLTCGDNNGAMNYYLRELGGEWSWADLEEFCIGEMSDLLGDEVKHADKDHLPFPDTTFDRVISIDVHEHLEAPGSITAELHRVTKPGGQVIITVPNGDETKLAVKMKTRRRDDQENTGTCGWYCIAGAATAHGGEPHRPCKESTFSRVFLPELLELTINYAYVMVLRRRARPRSRKARSRRRPRPVKPWRRPSNSIRSYPAYALLSKLDPALFFTEGYVVVVEGRRAA